MQQRVNAQILASTLQLAIVQMHYLSALSAATNPTKFCKSLAILLQKITKLCKLIHLHYVRHWK